MSIVLCATESLPLESVVKHLKHEGLDIETKDSVAIRNLEEFEPGINKSVLIVASLGAGDPTQWVRRLLGPDRPLILCTHQPDSTGYEMLKNVGATEIITPRSWAPEHIAERILGQLIQDGEITPSAYGDLRGATRLMRDAYETIEVMAHVDDHVLITGETGTGKELFAREIHNLSRKSDKFVALNCGGLSFELAGSELFGHKKGSFTGADARQGLLVEAGRGTVLLDEIGELDPRTQAMLLRVLQDKKIRPIGSNQTEDLAARIVFATNRNLWLECSEKRFRSDLFHRISGFSLKLEPLRERRADIPLLAKQFLAEFNEDKNTSIEIPPMALDYLFNYEWPGNVRQLRSAIRWAAANEDQKRKDFFEALREYIKRDRNEQRAGGSVIGSARYHFGFDPRVDEWKQFAARGQTAYFQALLDTTGGDRKEAQRLSGLSPSRFYEILKAITTLSEDGDEKGIDRDKKKRQADPVQPAP